MLGFVLTLFRLAESVQWIYVFITLTSTLIILDVTKTSSNNCLVLITDNLRRGILSASGSVTTLLSDAVGCYLCHTLQLSKGPVRYHEYFCAFRFCVMDFNDASSMLFRAFGGWVRKMSFMSFNCLFCRAWLPEVFSHPVFSWELDFNVQSFYKSGPKSPKFQI